MIVDVAPGLWVWTLPHPDHHGQGDWGPEVACTCVETGGEVALLDPLEPAAGDPVWERLDVKPPTVVAILKPDHVRHVDAFVHRYGARAYGPSLFWRDDIPDTDLEPILPGTELPGGMLPLYDPRYRAETPLWLPEQRALVFADALTAPAGELLVWAGPWFEERIVPGMRALLEYPFEHVIVSHGAPVHGRADFEAALERPPYSEPE